MASWADATLDAFNGDLVALWELDESAGLPRDSISGLDAEQAVGETSIAYSVAGISGTAIRLLGDSYFVTGVGAGLPAGDFTVAAWLLKTQSVCGVIAFNVGDAPGLTVLPTAVRWSNGLGVIAAATGLTQVGTWHHVAVVRESGTYAIYLDGSPLSASGTDSQTLAGSQVAIGISVEGAANATLDQVAVWDAALSAAAIAALYNSGAGRRYLDAGFAVLARMQRAAGVRVRHATRVRRIGHPSQFASPPPDPIPALLSLRMVPGVRIRHRRRVIRTAPRMMDFVLRQAQIRGRSRVFNPAAYRFYRSNSGPPAETDSPYATSATLPATPADTYADGTWYLSVSYYNGILDSGFLPIGPQGQTYRVLTISGGAQTGNPPAAPMDVRLVARPAGVVRVLAVYHEAGADRADAWALAYTVDGSEPPADTPSITQTLTGLGLEIFDYALPAQADGTTVKVRLQVRRNDGTDLSPVWVYSDSTVLTIEADADGPTAPLAGDALSEGAEG
jgi:hypothetical protein